MEGVYCVVYITTAHWSLLSFCSLLIYKFVIHRECSGILEYDIYILHQMPRDSYIGYMSIN